MLVFTGCVTSRARDPLPSPGATAPVWAESPPAVVTDIHTQPPAGTPSAPAQTQPAAEPPVSTKEPETTPPPTPTPPVPTEANPEATNAPVDDTEFPQTATLLQSVTVYDAEKNTTHRVSAGSTLRVAAKPEGEWWQAKEAGETVWLHLDEPDGIMVETPTGWLTLWVVLDGLDYNL